MFDDKPFVTQLPYRFNRLNRAILVADKPELWQAAIAEMNVFLDELEAWLHANVNLLGEDLATSSRVLSLLLSLSATGTQGRLELFKAKDVKGEAYRQQIDSDYLPKSRAMRRKAIDLAKFYLTAPVFVSLQEDIAFEILPLLESLDAKQDPDRLMAYRVIQIGNIYERLYAMRLRTADPLLIGLAGVKGLLREIYDRKYLRFGTSGVRGRWGNDFTETRARQVLQAICDFMNNANVPAFVGAEDLSGRRVVLGHDTRANADLVTQWAAEVCLANGFRVEMGTR
ncbi:MAG TPA: hypothetical protein PK459_03945, partial [Anaerolineaceae bacterium]|nr:hypothetical protein [Anaerolineaceae bacterium]